MNQREITQFTNWSEHSCWIMRPSFLRYDEETWFTESISEINDIMDEFYSDIKKEHVAVTIEDGNLAESIPKIERFSSFLLSSIHQVNCVDFESNQSFQRFKKLPQRIDSKSSDRSTKKILIKYVQSVYFKEDIRNLKNDKAVEKTNRFNKLSPMLENEGIFRINRRMSESENVCYVTKFSIILEGRHYASFDIALSQPSRTLRARICFK